MSGTERAGPWRYHTGTFSVKGIQRRRAAVIPVFKKKKEKKKVARTNLRATNLMPEQPSSLTVMTVQ
ncbi:hypothetical protein ACN42_g2926 [Penicillium freii]|uniref:Uncharacterized protein n=1 Tax=Penicillium freii TaxID=48697 RepID=A0A101MP77_PENFR|nr:hypothetical protein ACN42_g2926 [Penicillium freii]